MINLDETAGWILETAKEKIQQMQLRMSEDKQIIFKNYDDLNVKAQVVETYKKEGKGRHSCGHPYEMTFYYMELLDGDFYLFERCVNYVVDAGKRECSDCYNSQFFDYDLAHNLPELYGTIAQQKLARRIRAKAHNKFPELVQPVAEAITESVWWIEEAQLKWFHAKIWKETVVKDMQALNEEHRAAREKAEDRRLSRFPT